MSNPLDRHVETLRESAPRPEAVDRAVAAIRRPYPPRLVPLAVGVAALSLIALWPRGSNGIAWAQIAAQDVPPRYHETQRIVVGGKSRLIGEHWVDRPADSRRTYNHLFQRWIERGQSVATNPLGREFEFIETPRGFYSRDDQDAGYSRKPHPKSKYDPRLASNVRDRTAWEKLLGDRKVRQRSVERGVPTRVGLADRYTLERSADPRWEDMSASFIVYVQPGTKHILGSDQQERSGDVWQTTIDYPDRFPSDIFEIPPRGVKANDLDALNAKVKARLQAPIATLKAGGQTSTLRLVAQGDDKALWVFWTGGRPNGDLKQRVRVLGMHNGQAYSSLTYVSKGFNGHFSPFGGESVKLARRVDRVDLQIPVFAPGVGRSRYVGDATVRNVPVLHLPFVSGLDAVEHPTVDSKGTPILFKP